jgi:hypothetical protein
MAGLVPAIHAFLPMQTKAASKAWMPATSAGMTLEKLVPLAQRSEAMSNRTVKYIAGEIGRVKVIGDFLPSPDTLVAREDNVKVTLGLSRRSVEYFKRAAKARRVPYQRMIRALVDAYAERQGKR